MRVQPMIIAGVIGASLLASGIALANTRDGVCEHHASHRAQRSDSHASLTAAQVNKMRTLLEEHHSAIVQQHPGMAFLYQPGHPIDHVIRHGEQAFKHRGAPTAEAETVPETKQPGSRHAPPHTG